jgi:hypothetical protein
LIIQYQTDNLDKSGVFRLQHSENVFSPQMVKAGWLDIIASAPRSARHHLAFGSIQAAVEKAIMALCVWFLPAC